MSDDVVFVLRPEFNLRFIQKNKYKFEPLSFSKSKTKSNCSANVKANIVATRRRKD